MGLEHNIPTDIMYYTLEMFYEDSEILLQQIRKASFDSVLAIANGGIPLGTFLSKNLNIPLFTITIKSYCEFVQKEIKIIAQPPWEEIKTHKILVVDDLIDNGGTITCLKEVLAQNNIINFKIAVLIDKCKNSSVKPDYYSRICTQWIAFFWEKEFFSNKKAPGVR